MSAATCPSPSALRLPAERRLGALPLPHTLLPHGCACVAKTKLCVLQAILEKGFPFLLGIFSWKRGQVSHATSQQEECLFLLFLSILPAGLGSNPNHCFLKNCDYCSSKGDRLSWEDVVLVSTSDAQVCKNVADGGEG